MNLAQFPRRRYSPGPTPLESLDRLSAELGGPRIYIKRDDLLGGVAGGNKTRKLEFVVADALLKGADTLITSGAIQSNHCRLTLSAAAKEGLRCRLVLEERVPGTYNPKGSGNNLLYHLMGAERIRVVPAGSDMEAETAKEADEVAAGGGRPYVIPGGASNEIGALGYVACAEEILYQMFDLGLKIDKVVCASGSAGTQADLVCGFWGNNSGVKVLGINVQRTKEDQEPLVYDLARKTSALLGLKQEPPRHAVTCFGGYVGPGYSLATPAMVAAVKFMASREAVLLDPVYTGKAMAGLMDLCRKGNFKKDENILFIHTGGIPALYAYLDAFYE